jgi:hypothetical protein
MSRILISMRVVGTGFGLALATAVLAFGQQQAQQNTVRTAEQQFKNIKALTGTRADQLNVTMHGISGALGVDCVHCHVWDQWDLDVKPTKEVARRMITMVRQMNKEYFGGAQVVTCYTCHRGSPHPLSTAVLPDTLGLRGISEPAPPLPTAEVVKEPTSFPSPESILANYVQALGGEPAIRRITSRVIIAKRDYPAGPAGLAPVLAEVEIYQQAPNLTATISKAEKFTVSEGYDGDAAWSQNVTGVVSNLPEPDQQRAKRIADFYESLDLAKSYERMEVSGLEKVNGREAYVLVGYPHDDTPEKLFFDVKTGLLLRRSATLPGSLLAYPYEIDYDDYRKTGSGIMFPFVIRTVPAYPRAEAVTNSTLQTLEVKENVPIDASRFTRPASKSPTAPGR